MGERQSNHEYYCIFSVWNDNQKSILINKELFHGLKYDVYIERRFVVVKLLALLQLMPYLVFINHQHSWIDSHVALLYDQPHGDLKEYLYQISHSSWAIVELMIIYQRGRLAGREEIILIMCEIIAQICWVVRDRGEIWLPSSWMDLLSQLFLEYGFWQSEEITA